MPALLGKYDHFLHTQTQPTALKKEKKKEKGISCDKGAYPLDGPIRSFAANGVKDNMQAKFRTRHCVYGSG